MAAFGLMALLTALLAGCAQPTWRQLLQSEDPLRRIDGTIAAEKAQDRAASPLLVDRLEDDDVAVRMYAILALKRIEGTDLGYKFWAGDADRVHMAQRWRVWLRDRHQSGTKGACADRPPRTTHPDSEARGEDSPDQAAREATGE